MPMCGLILGSSTVGVAFGALSGSVALAEKGAWRHRWSCPDQMVSASSVIDEPLFPGGVSALARDVDEAG